MTDCPVYEPIASSFLSAPRGNRDAEPILELVLLLLDDNGERQKLENNEHQITVNMKASDLRDLAEAGAIRMVNITDDLVIEHPDTERKAIIYGIKSIQFFSECKLPDNSMDSRVLYEIGLDEPAEEFKKCGLLTNEDFIRGLVLASEDRRDFEAVMRAVGGSWENSRVLKLSKTLNIKDLSDFFQPGDYRQPYKKIRRECHLSWTPESREDFTKERINVIETKFLNENSDRIDWANTYSCMPISRDGFDFLNKTLIKPVADMFRSIIRNNPALLDPGWKKWMEI